jgi:hypothetical protein
MADTDQWNGFGNYCVASGPMLFLVPRTICSPGEWLFHIDYDGVMDHFIVAGTESVNFAKLNLISSVRLKVEQN